MSKTLFFIKIFFLLGLFQSLIGMANDQELSKLKNLPKYSRKSWPHWSKSSGTCLNTRNQILKERSLITPMMNKKGCTVLKGLWWNYYYPEQFRKSSEIDLDHLVPLKNAHISGGAYWTRQQKKDFANDPENLVITSKRYNRQKGPKGIDAWLPVHKEFACKYVSDWIKIKHKYALKFKENEIKNIQTLKKSCSFKNY